MRIEVALLSFSEMFEVAIILLLDIQAHESKQHKYLNKRNRIRL